MTLLSEIRSLNAVFKSNLGAFMSKLQGSSEQPSEQDIEVLLTHLDLIISNQKELGDLIQRVKVHQKLSRELELATESIKNTKAAIVDIISALQQRDLQLAHSLHETDALLQRMESIVPGNKRDDSRAFLTGLVIQNPEAALLSAQRLASTCAAPAGWEPGAPLQSHRPPYPTEDLIRQSGLFALMTQQRSEKRGEPVAAAEDTTQAMTNTTTTSTVAASRRRKAQDKSKLLDLDLNPDM